MGSLNQSNKLLTNHLNVICVSRGVLFHIYEQTLQAEFVNFIQDKA